MKAVQKFSADYLYQCRSLKPEEILRFLEEFRTVFAQRETPSKLISIKIPESLLKAFKAKAQLSGVRYQTQIKNLMRDWVINANKK